MVSFRKGDVVQVKYKSAFSIERWMLGDTKVGPDDVGVVRFDIGPTERCIVSVQFPMIGVYGIHSQDLILLARVDDESENNG
jgi:hypothetical protein